MNAPWDGLAVAVSADRVMLGPEAARLVLALLAAAERMARRDGIGLSPQLVHLRDILTLVADEGQADVRNMPDLPAWESSMGSGQVAELLGCSPRQARRLVASGEFGTPRRAGRSWQVPVAEVAAYAAQRKEAP